MTRYRSFAAIVAGCLMGCSDDAIKDGPTSDDLRGDPASGYAGILTGQGDQKADQVTECGTESCTYTMCGYACHAGAQCERSCATSDSRPASYVEFTVSGGHSAHADSRDHGYTPVVSLTNVLFYGCELWDYSSGAYDGLELHYSEIIQGAFLAGEPELKGLELSVYAAPFTGPGSYTAEGFFSKSSAARKAKDAWFGKTACGVDVQDDGSRGLKGTFVCSSIAHYGTGSPVAVSGAFACGVNAVDGPLIIRLGNPE